jgi:hypothetical protein
MSDQTASKSAISANFSDLEQNRNGEIANLFAPWEITSSCRGR